MKLKKWQALCLLALCTCMTQGCVTSDKPVSLKNVENISSIKAVRYESPQLMKKSAGSEAAAFSGIMFGAVGGGLGAAISAGIEMQGGQSLAKRCDLPDFARLVLEKFTSRIPEDLPQFNKLTVEDKPVCDDFNHGSDYALVVRVTSLAIRDGSGLDIFTTAKMVDPSDQVVWLKTFHYKSSDFGRCCSLDRLEAEGGKLFREEYFFAAENTVSNFIDHLKGPRSNETAAARAAIPTDDGGPADPNAP